MLCDGDHWSGFGSRKSGEFRESGVQEWEGFSESGGFWGGFGEKGVFFRESEGRGWGVSEIFTEGGKEGEMKG